MQASGRGWLPHHSPAGTAVHWTGAYRRDSLSSQWRAVVEVSLFRMGSSRPACHSRVCRLRVSLRLCHLCAAPCLPLPPCGDLSCACCEAAWIAACLSRCSAKSVWCKLKEYAFENDLIHWWKIWLNLSEQLDLLKVQPRIRRMKPISQFHTAAATPDSFQRIGKGQEDNITLNRPFTYLELSCQVNKRIKAPPANCCKNSRSPFSRIQACSPPSVRDDKSIAKIPVTFCRDLQGFWQIFIKRHWRGDFISRYYAVLISVSGSFSFSSDRNFPRNFEDRTRMGRKNIYFDSRHLLLAVSPPPVTII